MHKYHFIKSGLLQSTYFATNTRRKKLTQYNIKCFVASFWAQTL